MATRNSAFLAGLGLLALAASASAGASPSPPWILRPFTTDGCTDFPDGDAWNPRRWQFCCVIHDRLYWAGGTYEERLAADRGLRECVAESGASAGTAQLMYQGVRVGGDPYVMTSFRWGYGWSGIFGYRERTSAEQAQVDLLAPLDLRLVPIQ